MKTARIAGFAMLALAGGILLASQTKARDCDSPLWSAEVLVEPGSAPGSGAHVSDSSRAGIVFLNDKEIVVYEAGHDTTGPSSRAVREDLNPFSLRLSLIDSASGKLKSSNEQRMRTQESEVFVIAAGLLVKTGGRLALYSADLIQHRDVPFPLDRNSRFSVTVSASGKTIMLNEVLQNSSESLYSHFEVLDAGTLTLRYSWNASPPLYHHYSISDQLIAAVDFNRHAIVVSDFGSASWRVVGKESGICAGENIPTLFNDKDFFYGCDKFIAMSSDGQSLATEAFPNGETSTTNTAVAQHAPFVSVSVNAVEMKRHLLAESRATVTATHILVYDLATKTRVLTVNVQPLPNYHFDFALSPDGSKLAILNDRRASVCAVPD